MKLKEFLENFAEQFDDTESSEIQADTEYRELDEWTSLTALSIIAMIDDEYDVQLKADEMRKTQTIQELFDLVKSKK